MPERSNHIAFGPLGVRIPRMAASPDGQYLAFQHVPQNYNTSDYQWLFFRQLGDTYERIGELPGSPDDVAPLDDGRCLLLASDYTGAELALLAPSSSGMAQVKRWGVCSTISLSDARMRLLPSGREVVVVVIDRNDKQADWGGGPPPDYIQTWLLIDLATGETREETRTVEFDEPAITEAAYRSSRGVSVLVALGAPSWLGTRPKRECDTLQKIILPLARNWEEYAICAGRTRLLLGKSVIDIALGETLLRVPDDPKADRFEPSPRFHDLSPDENYALSSVVGEQFALWNISSW